jgi:hypothetical protein
MMTTAELVEKIEEAKEEGSGKKSWAILAQADGAASSKLRGLRVTGDWSLEKFGKKILEKFPEGSEKTDRVLEKQVWKKFADEVVEVDTSEDAEVKKLFRGSAISYVWYSDMKKWFCFIDKKCEELSSLV